MTHYAHEKYIPSIADRSVVRLDSSNREAWIPVSLKRTCAAVIPTPGVVLRFKFLLVRCKGIHSLVTMVVSPCDFIGTPTILKFYALYMNIILYIYT